MGENKKHETADEYEPKGKGTKYFLPLAAVLSLIILANMAVVSQANGAINEKVNKELELAKPAELEITKINALCTDCFNTSAIVSAMKQFKATITEKDLDASSSEAKTLISKYNISRLPTIIVTGDAEKAGLSGVWNAVGTIESDGALVMRIGVPFADPAGNVYGKPELVLLNDASCKGCYNVTVHREILAASGMVFSGERIIELSSPEGKSVLEKYNITKVPTMLISPDAKYYTQPSAAFGGGSLQDIWSTVGTIEKDGWYVFRNIDAMNGAVYYDLAQNKMINQTISLE